MPWHHNIKLVVLTTIRVGFVKTKSWYFCLIGLVQERMWLVTGWPAEVQTGWLGGAWLHLTQRPTHHHQQRQRQRQELKQRHHGCISPKDPALTQRHHPHCSSIPLQNSLLQPTNHSHIWVLSLTLLLIKDLTGNLKEFGSPLTETDFWVLLQVRLCKEGL